MLKVRLYLSCACIAIAQPAWAQELTNEADQSEIKADETAVSPADIIVTGFRASLFNAAPDSIVSGPQGLSGNYIIARVTGIVHPRVNPNDPGYAGGVQQLSSSVAGDFGIAVANAARARQGVKVNQQLVQSATGTGQ